MKIFSIDFFFFFSLPEIVNVLLLSRSVAILLYFTAQANVRLLKLEGFEELYSVMG